MVLTTGSDVDTVDVTTTGASSLLSVQGGDGDDSVTLRGTGAGSLSRLRGENENDTLTVLATAVGSVVSLDGGAGAANVLNIGEAGGSLDGLLGEVCADGTGGTSAVNVFDDGDASDNTYVVTDSTVSRSGAATVSYTDAASLNVDGGTGMDVFNATPSATTPYDLDGGEPTNAFGVAPGDTLLISPAGFAGVVVPLGVTNGTVTGVGMADVDFADFEFVLLLAPLDPDAFEPNDSISTATVLGSETEVTLRNLTIDVAGDEDFFKITAHKTGMMSVIAQFEHVIGDLNVEVLDADGNNILPAGVGDSMTHKETVLFPVVGQEIYFIRVFGVGPATNSYALEIENFAAPVPTSVSMDPIDDSGMMNNDRITNVDLPTVYMVADLSDFAAAGIPINDGVGDQVGAAVEIFVNGTSVGFASPFGGASNTLFTYTFAAAQLNEGLNIVTSAVHMVDGQVGPVANVMDDGGQSVPLVLRLDTTDPVAPANLDLIATSDSGDSDMDDLTNKMSPAITGTGEPGAKVRLFSNGLLVGQSAVTVLGDWEITTEPLIDGTHTITAEQEDLSGNVSVVSDGFEIVIDSLAPQRPTLDLRQIDDTGMSDIDNVTENFATLSFDVTAEAGTTVVIKDGNTIIDMILNFNPADPLHTTRELNLAEVTHLLSTESTDAAGNRSHQSEELVVLVDNTEPLVSTLALAPFSDTGVLGDNITSKMSPAFVGVAEVNTKVRIFANGTILGEGMVGSDETNGVIGDGLGEWEITAEPLADGDWDITVEIEDLAGNISDLSEALTITIDTLPPQRTTIDLIDMDDTGRSDMDNSTIGDPTQGDGIADFRISAETGTTVNVKDGETVIDSFTFDNAFDLTDGVVDNFGVLTIDFNANQGAFNIPSEGPHPLSTEAFDVAGNRGHQAEELLVTVDTVAPLQPAAPDLLADSDSGNNDSDNVTRINAPAFTGVAEANGMVRVYATNVNTAATQLVGEGNVGSDESDGTDTDGNGLWEVTIEPIDDGVYNFTIDIEDKAGNLSVRSTAVQVEIDTYQPNTAFLDLAEADDSGRHDDDNVTNVPMPDFTATSHDPNAALHIVANYYNFRIYDRPEAAAEVLLFESGFQNQLAVNALNLNLLEGYNNLKLEVEDLAGNISEDFLLDVVVDTVAPPVSIVGIQELDSTVGGQPTLNADRITNDTLVEFVGRAEADAIVRLYVDGQGGVNNDNDLINNGAEFSLTVAQPLDGDDAFANGQWLTRFIRDLNDQNFFDFDGVREVLVEAEDLAGNINTVNDAVGDADQVLDIFVDTQGPRVTNVQLRTQDGALSTYDLFDPKPTVDGPTPLTNQLSVAVQDLPLRSNQDANFLYDALVAAIVSAPGNITVVGDYNGIIPIQTVSFVPDAAADNTVATGRIEITFVDPLPDDRFTLTIDDDVVDPAGNKLDGDSNASQPLETVTFPSGDGQPGGDFIARFTVDSRPEIGAWSAGSVYIDTNGNLRFDPEGEDDTNEDIVYVLGQPSDDIFAGNFVAAAGDVADGFDKLAAYGDAGLPPFASNFRWLIDTDNDGVPNLNIPDPANINGLPVAGNFDFNAANGDEVGVFTGNTWLFDTTHNFNVNANLQTNQRGLPIVGDFDGDGFDDLGSYDEALNRFEFDLTAGVQNSWDGVVDQVFTFNFVGMRERPVAADMDQDGIDDIGLWSPDRSGVTPGEGAEWYFLISGGTAITDRLAGAVAGTNPVFTPDPFQNDIFAQFGDDYALPVVGNFDPPVAADSTEAANGLEYDVNGDGHISALDALLIIGRMGGDEAMDGYTYDMNGDDHVSPLDALMVINAMEDASVPAASSAASAGSFHAFQGANVSDAGEVFSTVLLADSAADDIQPTDRRSTSAEIVVQESSPSLDANSLALSVELEDLTGGLIAIDQSESVDAVDEIAADVTTAWNEE